MKNYNLRKKFNDFKSTAVEAVSSAKNAVVATTTAAVTTVTSVASAAIDPTAVQADIVAAQTSGETVGGYVIAAVAGLVVVTVIIGIVKKL